MNSPDGKELPIVINALANYYITKEDIPLEYDQPTNHVECYIPLTISHYNKTYSKLQATAVARMLALRRATIHENYNSIDGKLTESISDLFALFKSIKVFHIYITQFILKE